MEFLSLHSWQVWGLGLAATLVLPLAIKSLRAKVNAFPDKVLTFAVTWAWGYLKARTDVPTQRLLKKLAPACFQWAEEEMPDAPGPEKMDAIMRRLMGLPVVGVLVAKNAIDIRGLLEDLWVAFDAELKRRGEPPV